jgi:hypothetical protein
MARDYAEKKKQREEEDEADAISQAAKKNVPTAPGKAGGSWPTLDTQAAKAAGVEKLEELMGRAEPLIDQLNALYQMYIAGVESRPPTERRGHLDQLMVTLGLIAKPNATYQFRYQTILQSYNTQKERWDRMCKDLESGKIKRVTGPRRG